MKKTLLTILLLVASNTFMTLAWYGHLRYKGIKWLQNISLPVTILLSWGIALFEYVLQVPANRMGAKIFNLGQLKITQEIITMIVFALFSYFYMKKPLTINYLWAGLCLMGAAFFIFRDGLNS